MAHDVLISYSQHDKLQADAICNRLESQAIRCWIAPRDVPLGKEWADSIVQAIEHARVMVLVYSANADKSPQVRREAERAVSLGLPIIPVRIEDAKMSEAMQYYVGSMHWLDAITPPLEKHIDKLAHDIRALLENPLPSHTVTEEIVIPAPEPPVPGPAPVTPAAPAPTPAGAPIDGRTREPVPRPAPKPAPRLEPTPVPAERAIRKSRRGLMAAGGIVVLAAAGGGWYWFLGPGSTVLVPAVTGRSQAAAEALLEDHGLQVAAVLEDSSPTENYPAPLRTDPGAGLAAKRNSAVTLYVSGMVMVPDDTGLTQAQAMRRLAQAGIDTEKVVVRPQASPKDPGTVVRQVPAGGRRVLRGRDTVTLYVAGTTFPLPNLVGLEQTSAEQRIRDAQLKLMLVPEWDSTATLGTVLATDPAAGVDVSRGASVSLVVAMQGGWAWIKRTQLPDDYRDRHMRWQSTTNLRDAPSGNQIGSQVVSGGDSVRVLEIQRFPATGSWVKVVVFWSPPGR